MNAGPHTGPTCRYTAKDVKVFAELSSDNNSKVDACFPIIILLLKNNEEKKLEYTAVCWI